MVGLLFREEGERPVVRMDADCNKVFLDIEDGDAVDRVLQGVQCHPIGNTVRLNVAIENCGH